MHSPECAVCSKMKSTQSQKEMFVYAITFTQNTSRHLHIILYIFPFWQICSLSPLPFMTTDMLCLSLSSPIPIHDNWHAPSVSLLSHSHSWQLTCFLSLPLSLPFMTTDMLGFSPPIHNWHALSSPIHKHWHSLSLSSPIHNWPALSLSLPPSHS